jgi:5-methylcytosine-specific restriction endonuclease McrA
MNNDCVLETLKDANPIRQLITPTEIADGFGFLSVQKFMEWLDIAKLPDLFRHGERGYFMPKENMPKFTKRYNTCLEWDDPHLLRRLDRGHLLAHAYQKNRLQYDADGTGLCFIQTVKHYEELAKKMGENTDKCPYCLKTMEQKEKSLDHIQPLCKGGRHQHHNLVICCRKCNTKKSGKLYLEWIEELANEQAQSALDLYMSRYEDAPWLFSLNWYFAEDSHHFNFYEGQENLKG